MVISPIPPYDFRLSVSVFSRFKSRVADYFVQDRYRRVLRSRDNLYLIEAESNGDIHNPSVDIRTLEPGLKQVLDVLVDDIRRIIGADYDLKPFYELMDAEPETRNLKESLFGLKPPRSPTLFEALIIAITGQRISVSAALAVRERMAQRFGKAVSFEGFRYLEFPSADQMARASEEELRSLGLNGQKAKTIKYVSEQIARAALDLEDLCQGPSEQILTELTKIKGIGPWTVQYMLCRGLGRYDMVPLGDVGLRAGISKWYGPDKGRSQEDILAILSRFGDYSGYAAFYFIFSYAYDKYRFRSSGLH